MKSSHEIIMESYLFSMGIISWGRNIFHGWRMGVRLQGAIFKVVVSGQQSSARLMEPGTKAMVKMG